MRKESTGFLLAVLITAALLGGTYHFAVIRPAGKAEPAETAWTALNAGSPSSQPSRSALHSSSQPSRSEGVGSSAFQTGPTSPKNVPAGTSSERTATILKCHDPEIGEFFTNAATCEDADPHNRISIAEPLHTTPGQDRYSGQDYTPPEQRPATAGPNNEPRS